MESADADRRARRASFDFILERQEHCHRSLSGLADPRGRRVLVVGCGIGTEIFWALSRGATEVVGLDPASQETEALEKALRRQGLAERIERFEIRRLGIEDAEELGSFDLVLSYNVFEHLPDLPRAFDVCARLVEPSSGRIAVFTDPLFFSSTGSHLEHEPWEHLWGDPAELAERLRPDLPEWHALHWTDLDGFYREIGLNRMRVDDVYTALRGAGLVPLRFTTIADRNLHRLGEYLPRLEGVMEERGLHVADLAVEGVACELALLEPGAGSSVPVESLRETRRRRREAGFLRRLLRPFRRRLG